MSILSIDASAQILETDRFPTRTDWKTVGADRKKVGVDGKTISVNRRAIHITRKSNCATIHKDCAVIHKGVRPDSLDSAYPSFSNAIVDLARGPRLLNPIQCATASNRI
jgi:hypothetical protein